MKADDITKLAELARLELTDEEKNQLSTELTQVLEYVDQLNEVEVGKLEPTSQVTGLMNVLRSDEPTAHTEEALLEERKSLLAATPDLQDGYVRVPGVFSEDEA